MDATRQIQHMYLGYTEEPLQVRHLHTWREARTAEHTLHHLLLDKQGRMIVGTADLMTGQTEDPFLRPGQIYKISSFFVKPARIVGRCCSNNLELRFTNNTTFEYIPEPPPSEYHPTNMSEPVPFLDLYNRAFLNKERSDVIGRILAISNTYVLESSVYLFIILEDDCKRQILTRIADHPIVNALKAIVTEQERNGPVIATFTSLVGIYFKGKTAYKNTCSTRVIIDQALRMHRPMFYQHSNSNMPIFCIDQERSVELIRPLQPQGQCHSIQDLLFLLAEEISLNIRPVCNAIFRCLVSIQTINRQFGFFCWLCPLCSPQKHRLLSNDVCSNCETAIAHDDRIKSFYISADVYDETYQTTVLISHEAAAALLQSYPKWDFEEADVEPLLQAVIYRAFTFEVKLLPWSTHNRERFEVVSVWDRHAATIQD